jgi:hypothetical protein
MMRKIVLPLMVIAAACVVMWSDHPHVATTRTQLTNAYSLAVIMVFGQKEEELTNLDKLRARTLGLTDSCKEVVCMGDNRPFAEQIRSLMVASDEDSPTFDPKFLPVTP